MTLPDPVQALSSTAVELRAAKLLGNPDVAAVANAGHRHGRPHHRRAHHHRLDSKPAEAQAVAKAYSEAYVNQTQTLVKAQIAKITTVLSRIDRQAGRPRVAARPSKR